jgi:hypothetical protein
MSIEIPDGYDLPELVACVTREIAFRERVYPEQVARGRMRQAHATEQIKKMVAVRSVLMQLAAEVPAKQAALFGGKRW